MATQKPGEWASCILSRFEEQVRKFSTIHTDLHKCRAQMHEIDAFCCIFYDKALMQFSYVNSQDDVKKKIKTQWKVN